MPSDLSYEPFEAIFSISYEFILVISNTCEISFERLEFKFILKSLILAFENELISFNPLCPIYRSAL